MTPPVEFSPYLSWVDANDPNNLPAEVRVISASDLLRYENFAAAATTLLNELEATSGAYGPAITANTTAITALQALTAVATKTANYTLVNADKVVIGNGSSITLTLPSATVSTAGRRFTVKNIHATALTVASAAGTIDGAATASLAQWAKADYISNGSAWLTV